ncbi:uncharacterized protein LOC134527951 [Bacillus rossius redtenbacheri]|uniref:uncharacterized protein LOC134527951 n=1 Tax=Bacillus rossius redtenbacheri TaxID=93214 RepID=UPI002FDD61E7
MARKRVRTTNRAKWTAESMKEALNAMAMGRGLREVARSFGIPVSTLKDRCKSGRSHEASLGRNSVFSAAQEKELTNHIITMARMFHGITPVDLRRIAFEFTEKNSIRNNFNASSRTAVKDWLRGFLKRNPQVSLRKPEATSLNRVIGFSEAAVKEFSSNLETVMTKHRFQGSRIFNMDETGISVVQTPNKILAPKGQKQIGSLTILERGKNITVCMAMSASGSYIPPMFVFPRVRMSPTLKKGGPEGAIYDCSKNGWINEDLFIKWLEHFEAHAKPTKEDPVLLITDNHNSHKTLNAFNFCRDHGIVMITIPPHTSHRLQPLDLTFFGPLKNAYNRECDLFIKGNAFKRIREDDVAMLFNKAFMRVATIEKGVSGFSAAGIYPMNLDKFSKDDFSFPTTQIISRRTSDLVTVSDDVAERSEVENSHDHTVRPTVSDNENQALSTATISIRFSDVNPIPCLRPTAGPSEATPRHRSRQHSVIFTATPTKVVLEEAMKKKQAKNIKKT